MNANKKVRPFFIVSDRAEERRGGAGERCAAGRADGLELKDAALVEKGAALAAAQAMLEKKVGALEEAKAEVYDKGAPLEVVQAERMRAAEAASGSGWPRSSRRRCGACG